MCPTSFPNPNALGASFNKSAWKEMGQIIGRELRSLWLQGETEASSWSGRPHAGLDCWSPNVNVSSALSKLCGCLYVSSLSEGLSSIQRQSTCCNSDLCPMNEAVVIV